MQMNEPQILDFIDKHKVYDTLVENFNQVLKTHSIDDLDITDKDLIIQTTKITNDLIDNNCILFTSQVYQRGNKIGRYSLKYNLNGELIDDYFIMY